MKNLLKYAESFFLRIIRARISLIFTLFSLICNASAVSCVDNPSISRITKTILRDSGRVWTA